MFCRQTKVKKPSKAYKCEFCAAPITGEHVYSVSNEDGQVLTARRHIDCQNEIDANCGMCDGNGRCDSNPDECAVERFQDALDICDICKEHPRADIYRNSFGLAILLRCGCRRNGMDVIPMGTIAGAEKEWNRRQEQRRMDRMQANALREDRT